MTETCRYLGHKPFKCSKLGFVVTVADFCVVRVTVKKKMIEHSSSDVVSVQAADE